MIFWHKLPFLELLTYHTVPNASTIRRCLIQGVCVVFFCVGIMHMGLGIGFILFHGIWD
jgi:hypothetical protein